MNTTTRSLVGGLAFASALIFTFASTTAHAQGNLTPPGPPGPTMKTLQQIEPRTPISSLPFVITNAGAYYLTTNLAGGTTNGITVLASDVTLDLGGFVLDGNGAAFSGIAAPNTQTNLVVRNGLVKRWSGTAGIDALNVLNVHVAGVQATDNAGHGIRAGAGARIQECTCAGNGSNGVVVWDNSLVARTVARINGGIGIGANNGSTVSDCAAAGNRSHGIAVGVGATIVNCSSQANQADGIHGSSLTSVIHCTCSQNASNGVVADYRATIQSCTVGDNGGDGIASTYRAVIQSCTVSDNAGYGISTGGGSVVKDCVARINTGPAGILALDGSEISGCTSRANGGTNNADGIWAASGSTVTACSATENTGNGIIAGYGCTLSGNTARANKLDGIRFNSSCGVTGNTCDFNGNGGDGAGLHALGQAARIEDNHCIANDRGIDVDADRNVIIRNTCGFNTVDYDIVANNKVGVIYPAPNSGAVSGSDGQGSTGMVTTNPWANFSF
jgi:hypothetical protein